MEDKGYGRIKYQIQRSNPSVTKGEGYWEEVDVPLDMWEDGKETDSIMFEIPGHNMSIVLDADAMKTLITLALDRWKEYAR